MPRLSLILKRSTNYETDRPFYIRGIKRKNNDGLPRRSVRFMVKPDKKWNGFVNPPVKKSKRHYRIVAAPIPDLIDGPTTDAYTDRDELIDDPIQELMKERPMGSRSVSVDSRMFDVIDGSTTDATDTADSQMSDTGECSVADTVESTMTHSPETVESGESMESLMVELAAERAARINAEAKLAVLQSQMLEQTDLQKTVNVLLGKIDEMSQTIQNLQGGRITQTPPIPLMRHQPCIKVESFDSDDVMNRENSILPYPSRKYGPRINGNEIQIPNFFVGLTRHLKARIPYYYDEDGQVKKFMGLNLAFSHVAFHCATCRVPARITNNEFFLAKAHLPKCSGVPSDYFVNGQRHLRQAYVESEDDKDILNFCGPERLRDSTVISNEF